MNIEKAQRGQTLKNSRRQTTAMSTDEEILKFLKKNEIISTQILHFETEQEKLNFIRKVQTLLDNKSCPKAINNDIAHILLNIELDKENLQKLKKINWDDFTNIIEKDDEDQRKHKVYENFMLFLQSEFNLLINDKTLKDKTLTTSPEKEKEHINISKDIFEKKENYNIEREQLKRSQEYEVEIEFDYTEPTHKITVQDFTLYFTRRLDYFTKLLKSRVNMDNVLRISQLKDMNNSNEQVHLIGLVAEITQTKKGHYMITIEDKSASIKCFVNKDKTDLINIIKLLCLDEGIGIIGKIGDNIIWTDEIVIPSPPNATELKKTEEEHYIAFLSDIHFGAKVFVDEAFTKFLDWINARTANEELNKIARKVKYVIIAGDIIEGIGIYPNQGKDARILSTELQYHEAARWLSQIPKHIAIIIIPGNHDTSRLSEPQPKLPYDKAYALYNMPNTIFLSNPSRINLFPKDPSTGLEFYLYHGGSIFYYADSIQQLREKGGPKAPEEVIKFLLEKDTSRHHTDRHSTFPARKMTPSSSRKCPTSSSQDTHTNSVLRTTKDAPSFPAVAG